MFDVVGRLAVFLGGTILLFMVPLTIVLLKSDDVNQNIVDDAVIEFVDNARASGQISQNGYEAFATRVYGACSGCDIDIIYEAASSTPTPVRDASGNITGYTPSRMLQSYTEDDITGYIYYETDAYGKIITDASGNKINRPAPKAFPLKEGGYLAVRVTSNELTPGSQMLRLFMPAYKGNPIYSVYSGYVGNTYQNK